MFSLNRAMKLSACGFVFTMLLSCANPPLQPSRGELVDPAKFELFHYVSLGLGFGNAQLLFYWNRSRARETESSFGHFVAALRSFEKGGGSKPPREIRASEIADLEEGFFNRELRAAYKGKDVFILKAMDYLLVLRAGEFELRRIRFHGHPEKIWYFAKNAYLIRDSAGVLHLLDFRPDAKSLISVFQTENAPTAPGTDSPGEDFKDLVAL